MLHITGYPSRLCNRLCNRHTATATRPPPHSHRHMATATRPLPHGHRHAATATWPPPHGYCHTVTATRPSHPWPGHVPSHVPGYMPGYVINHMPGYNGTFNHGNLLRPLAFGPLGGPWPSGTRGHSFPLAHGHSFFVANTLCQLWPMAPLSLGGLWRRGALGPWRPPTYGGLWSMGYPWPR